MNPDQDDHAELEARISPEVLYRELVDESVLLDLKSQRYFGLDEVGTRIWQLVSDLGNAEEVIHAMLDEFDVDETRLRRDLGEFFDKLADAGLIELGPAAGPASD